MTGSAAIVIVNYRTAHLVVGCLRSIAANVARLAGVRVFVIDNASGDESVAILKEAIQSGGWHWVSVFQAERNGGFAYANNIGIGQAFLADPRVEYIVLLNPDTIVRADAIGTLVGFMHHNGRVGIAGSRLENANGEAECSAHHAPTPLGELESAARLNLLSRRLGRYTISPPVSDVAHRCDWVSGASLIVRRQVIEEIGFLDEGYFLYFEEVDYCARAREAGWEVWFVPNSRVVHLQGAATGIANMRARRPSYWYDSRRRYFVKHFGIFGLMLADALWTLGRTSLAVRRLLRLGAGGPEQDPKWFAFDLLWGDIRSLLTGAIWHLKRGGSSCPRSV